MMNSLIKDYYLNGDGSVFEIHEYEAGKNYSYREDEFIKEDHSRVIWSTDKTGFWLHIRYEQDQYCVTRHTEPPQSLQMKILIGAV
jgi:hypothetical protein